MALAMSVTVTCGRRDWLFDIVGWLADGSEDDIVPASRPLGVSDRPRRLTKSNEN
jgi:hypothetical protein